MKKQALRELVASLKPEPKQEELDLVLPPVPVYLCGDCQRVRVPKRGVVCPLCERARR